MIKQQGGVLRILLFFIGLFVLVQLVFRGMQNQLNGLDHIVKISLIAHLAILLKPLLIFIFVQILLYATYVYILWYALTTLRDLFTLNEKQTRYLTVTLTLMSIVAIMAANTYYVSHSFFASLIQQIVFGAPFSALQLQITVDFFWLTGLILLCIVALGLGVGIMRKQYRMRHITALGLLVFFAFVVNGHTLFSSPPQMISTTADKPNIFIIGFDALRPDFLSYFNKHNVETPNFDHFLAGATVFNESYTPLARTFPSWAAILTGQYPLHSNVREDNVDIHTAKLDETLAKRLQSAGYTTVYASDDNRFSYLNKEFGFDQLIGDNGNVVDYMMGAINDFPLSNLLIPTKIGKILFPYNYGNHAAAFTHDPNNFLDTINDGLAKINRGPLFMAVHFNVSAHPWQSFNDQMTDHSGTLALYKQSIRKADATLEAFLNNLKQRGLLEHAIVVLLSDHGIALALPGDRSVSETLYQGDKSKILLKRTRYITTKNFDPKNLQIDTHTHFQLMTKGETPSILDPANYGIDSSFGYGGDLLSLKQTHALLAFKGYGVNIGAPHAVEGRSVFIDIAPTILDLIDLPPLHEAEGQTLKACLYNPTLKLSNQRPIILESAFSTPEIEHEGIQIGEVVTKNFGATAIDPDSGLVFITPKASQQMLTNKQRAIIQGDWLLAYYPASMRYKKVIQTDLKTRGGLEYQNYLAPPYRVLLNLKTGMWTSEMNGTFAAHSPLALLTQQVNQFYGDEMKSYVVKHEKSY
jgi:arylsulfatase A-like enzyme